MNVHDRLQKVHDLLLEAQHHLNVLHAMEWPVMAFFPRLSADNDVHTTPYMVMVARRAVEDELEKIQEEENGRQ